MASLLLLRHGQIDANRKGLWHGRTDSKLTWRGRRQVKKTARYIAAMYDDLAAIYTSPLDRCLQTAKAIEEVLDIPPTPVADLTEYAIGEWEGMAFRALVEEHDFYERTRSDLDFSPPGGESLLAVSERIVGALERIHADHQSADQESEQKVLVVGHGAALAVALSTILNGDPRTWVEYPVANCSLTELVLSPSPYVNFFNSTQHL